MLPRNQTLASVLDALLSDPGGLAGRPGERLFETTAEGPTPKEADLAPELAETLVMDAEGRKEMAPEEIVEKPSVLRVRRGAEQRAIHPVWDGLEETLVVGTQRGTEPTPGDTTEECLEETVVLSSGKTDKHGNGVDAYPENGDPEATIVVSPKR